MRAADANPAVIFDLGGKFDRSFNQASFEGAERFKKETGIDYQEFELQTDAQREQALRRFAEQGNNPVIVAGFSYGSAMKTVAPEFPDTDFAIIDTVVDQPNVRSVVFKEQEGSYLVGMLAAMASKTGKVGFVGGMDIPLIRKFACGYVAGGQGGQPGRRGLPEHDRHHRRGLERPGQGRRARQEPDRPRRRRVYHAAGGTGIGVLQAAADAGVLGIGVDSNQNYLHPGQVLTSMLKRVDNAIYEAMMDVQNGNWTSGVQVMGLNEDGVGYALDENNEALITPEMKAAVDAAAAKIISGEIKVHDYMTDECLPGLLRRDGRRRRRGRRGGGGAPLAIELVGISKSFGAVQANRDIHLAVRRGTIHGIVGENGAGKSTLMSILYGFYQADAGEIRVNGQPIAHPRQPGGDPRRHRHGPPALHAGRALHRARERHPRRRGRPPAPPLAGPGAGRAEAARGGIRARRRSRTRSSASFRSGCSSGSRS